MIATQYNADNILPDVMHVTLDGCHQDPRQSFSTGTGLALFLFDIRDQYRHGLLHNPCAFNHLWQKHTPVSKQVANHVHGIHQRALDNIQRLC